MPFAANLFIAIHGVALFLLPFAQGDTKPNPLSVECLLGGGFLIVMAAWGMLDNAADRRRAR